ncbi:GIN domain-containing protein [Asticcacaulis sp. AND118]|uniref:GIN domain-containing protein n=1 Tax=Asticcacaulis sp. AND118 TaxID=2840468 RepID=UPI001CFFDBC4|nr:DUF2807 domain-containing protein [Asticcacaulis sp. AND118]UDF02477.1 DUF2807 domain-containing protein [Asticcacaulis sp. AND118]
MNTGIKAGVFAAVAGMAAAAGAQAATEVELKNMAARVIVTPENRSDVQLTVNYGKADVPKIMVSTKGDKLIATGQLRKRSYNCVNNQTVRIDGKGNIALADLPVVHLRVPMDARVASEGAVYGRIGAAKSLEFALGGCGDWTTDTVREKAELSIGGSGSVRAGNVGDAEVAIGGSGDIYLGRIKSLSGAIGGSGSIHVTEVAGPVDIAIGGSGDVRIDNGTSPKIDVSIAGSGNVRFGGEARDVDVSIVGAGDVSIRKVTGHVSRTVMGSGKIRIDEGGR